jgi:hypothetical protein
MRGQSARPHTEDRFDESAGGSLRAYGGLLTGWASTFAGALEVSRGAVVEAVDGPSAIDTFIALNGNRGTDAPGGSTNQIRSEEHDQGGVDKVFIAVTEDQFEALAERVGAEVSVG